MDTEPQENTHIPDQAERQRIVEEIDKTMLVEASAGTGKTTSMLQRMVALLKTGRCRIDTLAAVTFTRKAAAELRARFQVALEQAVHAADGDEATRLRDALDRVDLCFIGTIHSFCARLLRERPIEAGVDLAFQEIEPEEDMQLRETAWAEYVATLYAMNDPVLGEISSLGMEIGQLQDSFLEYANYPDVEEWPSPDVDLGDLTPVRNALAEYIQHMESLAPSFPVDRGSDQLMSAYELIPRLARNRDLQETAQLLEVLEHFKASKRCTQRCWPEGQPQGRAERDRWREFCEEWAEPLVERWQEKRYATVLRLLDDAAKAYEELRAGLGRLNYQDLLIKAAALLTDQPQIRRYFRRRFSHILVDEFQDTDPIQARVIMYLTATDPAEREWRACRPVPGSLFVVGDPKQSIYRFRRADIVTYSQVKNIILTSGGIVVRLTSNFRTVGSLLQWGNDVFTQRFPATETRYSPAVSSMDVGRHQEIGDSSLNRVVVPAAFHGKEDAIGYEADFIARHIRHAIDSGVPIPRTAREIAAGIGSASRPGDFLIIAWGKKHLLEYAAALQRWGIPHEVSGSSALSQVPELDLLLTVLRALTEPENPVALVAVLRGPLFGINDAQLYSFKKAGGRFSFRSRVPESLESSAADCICDAYGRLQQCASWLRRLPPVAAIERIAYFLGLPMHALSNAGGRVQAGSLLKAFELLRAAQSDFCSVTECVDYLRALINESAELDGIPVRPYEDSVVRVMNLHKAKGLEAPIVFLANPTGRWSPKVGLHVDRAGGDVAGYLAIHAGGVGRSSRILAKPASWNDFAEEEQRFQDAEDVRLFYVAATRAGTQLNIVQHEEPKSHRYNYWHFFEPFLTNSPTLADPQPEEQHAVEPETVDAEEVQRAVDTMHERWQKASQPTYAVAAAKEVGISASGLHRSATAGEHGTEWGTVIHYLLETAMRQPSADLRDLAYVAMEEQGLDKFRVDEALEIVEKTLRSEFWQRAQESEQVLVEVPFQHLVVPTESDRGIPTMLRGVIDLVFRESGQWVVVDYKSDASAATDQGRLVEHYRGQVNLYAKSWEEMIGEPVGEKALFFTATQAYVVL